jgi:prepilin-type N-terminal cleavage/methylation domain-containing protein
MKTNTKPQRRGFTLVELLVVITIIAALIGLTAPKLMSMRKKADQLVAINNGKSLAVSLMEFSHEYGGFPDKETAKQVADNTGSTLNLNGETANDYFRQVIAAGKLDSEEPFFSKTSYTKKPDNNFKGSEALKAGEVGFGYIMNGTAAIGSDNPNLIIAVTPLLQASPKGEFDAAPLDKMAALVYVDSSVKLKDIRQDNKKVTVMGSKTLLDSGEATIWGADVKPVIKVPLKKK